MGIMPGPDFSGLIEFFKDCPILSILFEIMGSLIF